MADGLHQGVDIIRDFRIGDKVDLFDFFKGTIAAADIGNVIEARAVTGGTMVAVKMGDAFVDVVNLQGISAVTAGQMASDGMMLV